MIDVACVCVGDKFNPNLHVKQLYLAISKYLHQPFRFNVLTDRTLDLDITYNEIRVPDLNLSAGDMWWYKSYLFSREFTGTVLYFDLDTIPIGSLDKLIDYNPNDFLICQDFNRKWLSDYQVSNSSVMRWHAPNYYDIWDNFIANKDAIVKRHRGDQDYLTEYFTDRNDKSWWPTTWAMSFKWELFRGGLILSGTGLQGDGTWPADPNMYSYPAQPWIIPSDCSVVVFHGQPDPWDTDFGKQHLIPDV
tara:strand:+ start:2816 stop:3559 length:744 start_codon:yes stop_codon:yes gene_type:complete